MESPATSWDLQGATSVGSSTKIEAKPLDLKTEHQPGHKMIISKAMKRHLTSFLELPT